MTLMETNQLLKSSKKRFFAVDEHVHHVRSPAKRRAVSTVRSFPKFCGPNAPSTTTLSDFEYSSVIDTTGSPCVAIAAVPLTMVEPEGVHLDFDSSEQNIKHGDDLKDLSIVCYEGEGEGEGEGDLSASRKEVLNARKVFDESCEKLLQEIYQELKGGSCYVYARAASLMRNQKKWVNTEPRMGHVPGVEIGDRFGSRAELVVVGLHHQFMAGINWMKINGKNFAISIVDSGRYENKTISTDSFVYSGHGGNEKLQKAKADQKLEGGNLSLKNSMDEKYAVRVIRKHIEGASGKHIYVYEGLYIVSNLWLDRLQNDRTAYMFEMTRLPDQPEFTRHFKHRTIKNEQKVSKGYHVHPSDDLSNGKLPIIKHEQKVSKGYHVHPSDDLSNGKLPIVKHEQKLSKGYHVHPSDDLSNGNLSMIKHEQKVSKGYHVHPLDDLSNDKLPIVKHEQKVSKGYHVHPLDDLSNGKEKIPIHVVNEINDEKPPDFTYITEMKYPDHISSLSGCGCGCINGCSDGELCCCGIKNGGELPFNEEGCIVRVKRRLVHECGPSCKCPPSCQNRVSQHGLRYRLEVFKTKSTGWGIRSPDAIPSGGFVCEYIGEFLKDKEAEERINDDEYLFDLDKDGFTIDALKYGNVGRFINHSCSPNLYAQKVLYDYPDKRTPHIMFFATEDLPPLKELTYDYNYTIGRVCDAFGNIKIKSCHCGSHECTGRLY